jgi:hypothetical protein
VRNLASCPSLVERCQEINEWVESCLDGLKMLAKPPSAMLSVPMVEYRQAVLFEARDVERSDRSELQDSVLGAVKAALKQGIGGLLSRDADPSWGWFVFGTRDLSAATNVDRLGVRLYDPSMPKYACWIVWRGPMPPTWPHMTHLGQAETALSYPVGFAPTW